MPSFHRRLLVPIVAAVLALAVPATASAGHRSTPKPPSVTTGGGSSSATSSAALTGSVNPNGSSTTYEFQYGTSTSYGSSTASTSVGSGTSSVSAGVSVSGLSAGTTYHFRLVASSSVGTTYGADRSVTTEAGTPASGSELSPQTVWVAPGTAPLSDSAAAALVTHELETRPGNVTANDYVPTSAQLQAFYSAVKSNGETVVQSNPLDAYVTGRPGLSNPSTDDLIQWAAHKWGIPEDWLRAEMVVESAWNQSELGDLTTVSSSWYSLYPPQAQASGSQVYQSMGISQIRWAPDGSDSAGTEPLRWESTAFALDYLGATIRWYYDGDCSWCGSGYSAGQQWNSVGAWYEPYPWGNSGQQSYVQQVQTALTNRTWTQL